jgi:pimeloyl-ACP methyl ester carboxylesterase
MIPTTFQETILKCKNPSKCLGDLVFIHGFCVDHTYFQLPVGDKLAQHFNVYMIDLPGHGTNVTGVDAKDLNFDNLVNYVVEYIKSKNLKNIILVGHSMGGGIVSLVESKIRNRIKKIILVSPYCTGGL